MTITNPTFTMDDGQKSISVLAGTGFTTQSSSFGDVLTTLDALHGIAPLSTVVFDTRSLTITFLDARVIVLVIAADGGNKYSKNTGTNVFSQDEYDTIRSFVSVMETAYFGPSAITKMEIDYD